MTAVGGGLFAGFFVMVFVISLAPLIAGGVSLVSIATTPEQAFGPWWDNVKMHWLIGVLVSFVVPLGGIVTTYFWFAQGRPGVRQRGLAGRPFWAGPPKPYPPAPPPQWGQPPTGPPPAGPPPAGPRQPPPQT